MQRIIFGILLLMAMLQPCLANGVYFPERAEIKLPDIPSQSSLIIWRDGMETLIVESTLRTKSRRVGWIIPVPSEPTEITIADADMLPSLAMVMQPKVIHDLSSYTGPLWFVVVLLVIVTLGFTVARSATSALVLVGLLLLLWAMMLPSLARPRGAESDGVEVLASRHVGDYLATVIRADDADALSQWLRENELSELAVAAHELVNTYIGRGWCFVVTQLAVADDTPFAPNALALTFPTDQPVFPMRLTSLAGSETRVDLYVASTKAARSRGFDVVSSDRYTADVDGRWGFAVYRSGIGLETGNDDAIGHLWDGCIITHLRGTLSPAEMAAADVEITFHDGRPVHQRVWTERGRNSLVLLILGSGAILFLVSVTVTCYRGRRPNQAGRVVLVTVAAATFLASAGVALAWPTAESISVARSKPRFRSAATRALVESARYHAEVGNLHGEMKVEEALEKLDMVENYARFAGHPPRIGRVPGGVAIRKKDGATYFCVYTETGGEVRVRLPEAGTDGQRSATE